MLSFVALVAAIGWFVSYYYNSPVIFYIAVVIAVFQSLMGYYAGDKIVLSTSGARQIKEADNPTLWNLVENIAITAGLPMPKVYIITDPAPNAFATGRDPAHASVAVTTGLLDRLEKNELEGVIAHEMSHVGNYDIRLMTITAVLVSIIALISDLFIRARWLGLGGDDNNNRSSNNGILVVVAIIAVLLAPLVATLVQLAISRKREYLADADGGLLTRYPEGLASALEKISAYSRPVKRAGSATAHLYIANPLSGGKRKKGSSLSNIFSTHPPIEERIRILRGIK